MRGTARKQLLRVSTFDYANQLHLEVMSKFKGRLPLISCHPRDRQSLVGGC